MSIKTFFLQPPFEAWHIEFLFLLVDQAYILLISGGVSAVGVWTDEPDHWHCKEECLPLSIPWTSPTSEKQQPGPEQVANIISAGLRPNQLGCVFEISPGSVSRSTWPGPRNMVGRSHLGRMICQICPTTSSPSIAYELIPEIESRAAGPCVTLPRSVDIDNSTRHSPQAM